MPAESLTIEQVLTQLAEYPARIGALTEGLTPAHLRQRPEPEEWSVNEVLAHLRSSADVWGGYIKKIIAEDRPSIKAISPRTWMRRVNYHELEFAPSFEAFRTQRADLLAMLQPLPPEGWTRAATVTKDGKVREMTALVYATQLANHEQVHVVQIEAIVHTLRL